MLDKTMITITYMCLKCFSDTKIIYKKERDFSLSDDDYFEKNAPDKCVKCNETLQKGQYVYSVYFPGEGFARK